MRQRSRGITLSLAGWLWADLLLGAFVIFAVANSIGSSAAPPGAVLAAAASPSATPVRSASPTPAGAGAVRPPGVDPVPTDLTVLVNGVALLSGDPDRVSAEQRRILEVVTGSLGQRRVALVLAYGSHADLATGERLAQVATAALRTGIFEGAAVKAFHNQVAGDPGRSLLLSVYFYQ